MHRKELLAAFSNFVTVLSRPVSEWGFAGDRGNLQSYTESISVYDCEDDSVLQPRLLQAAYALATRLNSLPGTLDFRDSKDMHTHDVGEEYHVIKFNDIVLYMKCSYHAPDDLSWHKVHGSDHGYTEYELIAICRGAKVPGKSLQTRLDYLSEQYQERKISDASLV